MEIGILVVLVLLGSAFLFQKTARYTEERILIGTVVKCEKGAFCKDQYYWQLATLNFWCGDYDRYWMYFDKAQEDGSFQYFITVVVMGEKHIVVRDNPKEVGKQVVVKKIATYQNGKCLETTYE